MSDAAPPVLVAEDGGVASLVLNRPQQGNSLSGKLVAALHAALDALAPREDVKVVALSGACGRMRTMTSFRARRSPTLSTPMRSRAFRPFWRSARPRGDLACTGT